MHLGNWSTDWRGKDSPAGAGDSSEFTEKFPTAFSGSISLVCRTIVFYNRASIKLIRVFIGIYTMIISHDR